MKHQNKILVFHPSLAPYRIDFFNELATRYEPSFYFYYPWQAYHSFSKNYLSDKCNFEINYLKNGFTILKRFFVFGIGNLLKQERPNVVLCCEFNQVTLSTFIYYWLWGKKFKLYTICDDSLENVKERKGYRLILRNLIAKRIDGVIYPSKLVGEWVKQNISSQIDSLELPIIHSDIRFRALLDQSLELSNSLIGKYSLANYKIILYVGRLAEVKNLSLLLEACSSLKTSDWKLILVGAGPLEETLNEEVASLNLSDNIHFLGSKEGLDLLAWYNISQVFVLPSIHEPFGAVVNEALLAGSKVLCSELAGAATLVTKENGDLFNPYNVHELIKKLEAILIKTDVLESSIKNVRNNCMPFSFDEKVNALLLKLKNTR